MNLIAVNTFLGIVPKKIWMIQNGYYGKPDKSGTLTTRLGTGGVGRKSWR